PSHLLQVEQRRVDGSLIEVEDLAANLLDAACEPVPVERAESLESLEDHQVEGTRKDLVVVAGHLRKSIVSSVGSQHKDNQEKRKMSQKKETCPMLRILMR